MIDWIPLKLKGDNNGVIALVKNRQVSERSKHIDIVYYYIRDLQKLEKINVSYVSTNDMKVDDLTKSLTKQKFQRFLKLIDIRKFIFFWSACGSAKPRFCRFWVTSSTFYFFYCFRSAEFLYRISSQPLAIFSSILTLYSRSSCILYWKEVESRLGLFNTHLSRSYYLRSHLLSSQRSTLLSKSRV